MRIAAFMLLGVIVEPGCGRSETADAPPAQTAVEAAPELAACAALGQAFCERTSVPCEMAESLFERAQLPETDCAEARRALEDLDSMPPDTRGRAQLALLEYVMKKSPVIDQEALAELTAKAQTVRDDDPPPVPGAEVPEAEPPADDPPQNRFEGYMVQP